MKFISARHGLILSTVGLLLELRANHAVPTRSNRVIMFKQGSSTGHGWTYTMSPTVTECLERARECERYAARTGEGRKFLLRMAKHWTPQAASCPWFCAT